jgi:flagellin
MGVTGVSGAAASAFGANETTAITFPSLGTGEGFTLNGMTFTSAATTTAIELAAAFSNLKSGMSALAAAAANPTAVTKGSFSGTFAEGFTTGSSNGANVVTATATSKGNVGDIVTSPVLSVATTPGAAAVAVAATTAGVAGTVKQVSTATFSGLSKGQSVTFAGLTFTAAADGITAAQVATAFKSVATTTSTITTAAAQALWTNSDSGSAKTAIGSFTSGTSLVGAYETGPTNADVKFTAAAESNTQINMAPSAAASTAAPALVKVAGTSSAAEFATATFVSLTRGQSVVLAGLTFTAAADITAAQVATAFRSLGTVTAVAYSAAAPNGAQAKWAAITGHAAIGSFTSGTPLAGTFADAGGTDQVKLTITDTVNGGNTITSAGVTAPTAPTVAATTLGKLQTPQVSTATFTNLEAGASVSFAGLTFTSGTAGTTADQLKAAFAKVAGTSATTGQTFTQVNTTAGSDVSDSIGRFTSGTAITGGTFAAGGGTGQVTWTAGSNSDTQITLASTGSMESSVVTFSELKTGQSFNLNGLGFTAKKDLTSAEVASAFASLTSGTSTTPANTANGNYSGSWTAGYSTAAASGATVKATATVAGTADILFSSSKSVTTQGITVPASTVYGTVTLNSQNTFTIKPGAKAYATAGAPAVDPTYANFTALGFEAKTINAKNIGRLNFQVGPAANQLISIDLADFGKNGDITGLITSDRAPTNLLTVNSSNDVIMNVNKSLDRIAATRATMGAVMNRLEHVISNLTNVVMNSEASRSQIEDADYAQASTELARTQIMQQAATAVLAQANTSQQTVLKLLQG